MKTGQNKVEHGRFVRFSIREDRLRIFLLPAGRERLLELAERYWAFKVAEQAGQLCLSTF